MNLIDPENNGASKDVFDLEECYNTELAPLVLELCDKARDMGLPIFVVTCYKAGEKGTWLASSARGRGNFVPTEFHLIRAIIEGQAQLIPLTIEE